MGLNTVNSIEVITNDRSLCENIEHLSFTLFNMLINSTLHMGSANIKYIKTTHLLCLTYAPTKCCYRGPKQKCKFTNLRDFILIVHSKAGCAV